MYIHLRRNLYASAHFTTRFPGHAFCSTQVDGDKDKSTSWQAHEWADRQHHKARHARQEEKKWRESIKIMLVHHVGNRECHSRLRHPKRFFGRNDYTIKIQSIGSLFVIVAAPETLLQTKRKLYTWLFFILASKFIPHPRISQSDFPVMCFVQHKSQ